MVLTGDRELVAFRDNSEVGHVPNMPRAWFSSLACQILKTKQKEVGLVEEGS